MMTISCYTFHPIIQRFVRLYRCVQVASAWLTCLLSIFCCSCWQAMPRSRTSSVTTASYLKSSSVEIDTGRSKEQVTIDIAPAAGDTYLTEKSDQELTTQAELEGVEVVPVKKVEPKTTEPLIVPVHKKPLLKT